MLTDVFTQSELLAAADAADVYPSGHYIHWGVTADGLEVGWQERFAALHL
jgi:hypothetical protein